MECSIASWCCSEATDSLRSWLVWNEKREKLSYIRTNIFFTGLLHQWLGDKIQVQDLVSIAVTPVSFVPVWLKVTVRNNVSQVCDRESCDRGGGGSAKGDVCPLCKSIPQGWAAGWGGGVTEPGRWHRGHREWVIKLVFLWAGVSVQPVCSSWSWGLSFGRVATFSGTMGCFWGCCGDSSCWSLGPVIPCVLWTNSASTSDKFFSVWAVSLKGPKTRRWQDHFMWCYF